MSDAYFVGKKVAVIGYGVEGQAVVRYLLAQGQCAEILVADQHDVDASGCASQTGPNYLAGLERFDILVKSPGVKLTPELERLHDCTTSLTDIGLRLCAQRGATVVGITGTQGKSTTSSLICAILKAAGRSAILAGNIGEPLTDHLDRLSSNTVVVQEMSSYQLLDIHSGPQIAVVTSFHPDHMDYHGSLESYRDAKKRITQLQTPGDSAFYLDGMDACREIASAGPGTAIPVRVADLPLTLADIRLKGEHNLGNCALAFAVAQSLEIPEEVALQAIRDFSGLEHRLQEIGTFKGIRWVDDAIATTPEATMAGLRALNGEVATIILGGLDRGYDFREFAAFLAGSSVKTALLFPGSGPHIRTAIEAHGSGPELIDVAAMQEAVAHAYACTPEGAICLLSTASPSYGLFKNFKDKGEQFVRWVKELAA